MTCRVWKHNAAAGCGGAAGAGRGRRRVRRNARAGVGADRGVNTCGVRSGRRGRRLAHLANPGAGGARRPPQLRRLPAGEK